MRSFDDNGGRSWKIDVTVQTLLDIRDELSINLLDPPRDFPDTMEKTVGVLWVCCRDQEPGISKRDFGRRLTGDCLHAGLSAFVEEIASFFNRLDPTYSTELRLLWVQAEKAAEEMKKLAETAFSSVSLDSVELQELILAGSKDGKS